MVQDSEVDARLGQMATNQATQLKGKAAIANARLAYQAYEEVITSQRWQKLAELGLSHSGRSGPPPASRTPPIPTLCT